MLLSVSNGEAYIKVFRVGKRRTGPKSTYIVNNFNLATDNIGAASEVINYGENYSNS